MIPKDIRAILADIRKQLPKLFGDNLFGIYLYGSLSYGSFNPQRSDIDCIVVIKRKLSREEIGKIKRWYAELARNNSEASHLEMCFVEKDHLVTDGRTISRTPQLWNGTLTLRKDSDGTNPIVWKNIRECGIVLYGPKPKTFVPSISDRLISMAQRTELLFIVQKSAQWMKVPANRAYIVTTLCRILYTLKHRRLAPKKEALSWCLTALPQVWYPLISEMIRDLDSRRGQGSRIDVDTVKRFVRFVSRCVS